MITMPRLLFQSTHPHGVRRVRAAGCLPCRKFQSTHPHGVRLNNRLRNEPQKAFQSTHPHGVRLIRTSPPTADGRFQSTHPHGVRPILRCAVCEHSGVSIHAPTRGATRSETQIMQLNAVSIHAPTRGATYCPLAYRLFCPCFNPRTHTGCDIFALLNIKISIMFQSTHPHGVRRGKRFEKL